MTKVTALVATPAAFCTTSAPVVAPAGTRTVTCVALNARMSAGFPLNVTFNPGVKFKPSIVTTSLVAPFTGVTFTTGPGWKWAALMPVPAGVVTATGPLAASAGTIAVTSVSDTNVNAAGTVAGP